MNNVICFTSARQKAAKPGWTLAGLLAAILMVELRDQLAAQATGDGADAAFTWGL